MQIKKIEIDNLRNHTSSEIELSEGINLFYGSNGAGKTTILEALSICAFSKSFLPTLDKNLIKRDADYYRVRSDGVSDNGSLYFINIAYKKNERKIIKNSESDNLIPKDIIGKIPVVILSPDFKSITFGSPADRRSFINRVLAQISPIYAQNILKLKKVVKQRNNLLASGKKNGRRDTTHLDVLTEMMINISAEIALKRKIFILEFMPYFIENYLSISNSKEIVGLKYEPDSLKTIEKLNDKALIVDAYFEKATYIAEQEIRRGTTLFGPQKDDISILINGFSARENASQGQHKSLLIALKFAEYQYMNDKLNETPIVLLDDIFAELDIERSQKVVDFINHNKAQSLITITNAERIKTFQSKNHSYFEIVNGKSTVM